MTADELIRAGQVRTGKPIALAAKEADVSTTTIHRMRRGQGSPRQDVVGRVAHALDIDPELLWAAVTNEDDRKRQHPVAEKRVA